MIRFIAVLLVVLLPLASNAAIFASGGFSVSFGDAAVGGGSPPPDPPDPATSAYVTVVVFGDSQAHISGTDTIPDGQRYADMNNMVQWVLDNKTAENIQLVLHVGDMIDSGNNLPLSSACDGDTATPAFSTCTAQTVNGQGSCEAVPGCGYAAHNGNCVPCTEVDEAANEWVRFDNLMSQLEGEVPFIFAKGNHDNSGAEAASWPDREPNGYDQYYDQSYWEGLEAGFSRWNYDHLESESLFTSGVYGTSRAWLTNLGGIQHLVVSPAAGSGDLIPSASVTWAKNLMQQYPSTPVILLAHFIGPTRIPDNILDVSESDTPNLYWAAGGHTGGNTASLETNGNWETVLETVTDRTNAGSWTNDTGGNPQDDYFTLVRIYFDEDPPHLAVRDFSPASGLFEEDSGGTNTIVEQDFEVEPAIFGEKALYDLTPYRDEIRLAFSDTIDGQFNPPQWPKQPGDDVALSTCNVTAGSYSSLTSCINDNTHIVVPAGDYGTSRVDLRASNVWLDSADGANFGPLSVGRFGGYQFNTIKVTGGHFDGGDFFVFNGVEDLTIDGVSLSSVGNGAGDGASFCSGQEFPCHRFAILNSSVHFERSNGLFSGGFPENASDFIIANVDMWSDYGGGGGAAEYCWRMQYLENVIMVDSQARTASVDTTENVKPGLRIHYYGRAQLYTNNLFQCEGECGRAVWLDTSAGTGTIYDTLGIYLIRNVMENTSSGSTITDIAFDDSDVGPPGILRAHAEENVGRTRLDSTWNTTRGDVGSDFIITEINNSAIADLDPAGGSGNLLGLTKFSGGAGVSVAGLQTEYGVRFSDFALNTGLYTSPAELRSGAGGNWDSVVSDVEGRASSAKTFDYDLPGELWTTTGGNCVPSVTVGGNYNMELAARDIMTLAMDYVVNRDVHSAIIAEDEILNFTGLSFTPDIDSRSDECALSLSESIPNLIEAALLLEASNSPTWSAQDRHDLADWLVGSPLDPVSYHAENGSTNWSAEAMRALFAIAAYVEGAEATMTLWDGSTPSPNTYRTVDALANFNSYIDGRSDTCQTNQAVSGMATTGALADEMRRGGAGSPYVECLDTDMEDSLCTGQTLPGSPYDAIADCGGASAGQAYQQKAMQGLTFLAEAERRASGTTTMFDSTRHGGLNEVIYDGLLISTTSVNTSAGNWQDFHARDASIGAFHVAGSYYGSCAMSNPLRDVDVDAFSHTRGSTVAPWTLLTHRYLQGCGDN